MWCTKRDSTAQPLRIGLPSLPLLSCAFGSNDPVKASFQELEDLGVLYTVALYAYASGLVVQASLSIVLKVQ